MVNELKDLHSSGLKHLDNIDNLPADKAKFVLAETKLKLQNIMTHLEMLETRLVESDTLHKTAKQSLTNSGQQ